MKTLPIYEVVIQDDEVENLGLSYVSFVKNPAIERNWIAMNKESESLRLALDEEKRIVTGPVLIPDQLIYRKNKMKDSSGKEYWDEHYIVWSKETIKQAAISFFKNAKGIKRTTLEHDKVSGGIVLFESWLKEFEEDKSNALFSNPEPIGTLFQSYYVESESIWQSVKRGEFKGFSIEAEILKHLKQDMNPVKQSRQERELESFKVQEFFDIINKYKTI